MRIDTIISILLYHARGQKSIYIDDFLSIKMRIYTQISQVTYFLPLSLLFVVCHAKRKKLTSKIQKIRQGKQHLGGLKLYLNGFIKPFNRTIKCCFFEQTSLIGTKTASYALLCGVCTNHCNIDGNSLIANFLYKIQYKY